MHRILDDSLSLSLARSDADLHIGGVHGVVYDQPTCLAKFLALGMPLSDVVNASTAAPAAALRLVARWAARAAGLARPPWQEQRK